MTVSVTHAMPAHVAPLAARLRDIDRLECHAMGHEPEAAIGIGLAGSSIAWTALVDGEPHAMFGATPRSALDGTGMPWFLGSDEVMRHGRELLRWGPRFLDWLHIDFRRLANFVSTDNLAAHRLLRRWGFMLEPEVRMFNGHPFFAFWSER